MNQRNLIEDALDLENFQCEGLDKCDNRTNIRKN
jgi:hypothetical protein